jgi:hypothetical protein
MGFKTRYPRPNCPQCNHPSSKVNETCYTDDNKIVRCRKCDACNHAFWTTQLPESIVDPSTTKVDVGYLIYSGATSTPNIKPRTIRLIPLDAKPTPDPRHR